MHSFFNQSSQKVSIKNVYSWKLFIHSILNFVKWIFSIQFILTNCFHNYPSLSVVRNGIPEEEGYKLHAYIHQRSSFITVEIPKMFFKASWWISLAFDQSEPFSDKNLTWHTRSIEQKKTPYNLGSLDYRMEIITSKYHLLAVHAAK